MPVMFACRLSSLLGHWSTLIGWCALVDLCLG